MLAVGYSTKPHLLGVVHVHVVQLVGAVVVVTLQVVGGDGLGRGPTQKKTIKHIYVCMNVLMFI